ncbi:MAG: adenine phosphoribosyltransferase [Anaerolineae bacterium]|nr:adenine phosphoribosyltransferase [Anaerolineae bacterium]NIN97099.1 adenine phosphoribosyltransferase [Anaerolineae bacterium]NIQ80063.1 adenine phosphoribosyltransferase [Anaerolineae bacterium]
MDLAEMIRDVPDFPKEGIIFKDITTLIKDPEAFKEAVNVLADRYAGQDIDLVAAVEARGYIFGAPIALKLGAGFIPVRKVGKLPAETLREEYELEYGSDAVEMHKDAIQPGQKVLIVDDLIATGGSAAATARLVERLGGEVVGIAFLIELTFLDGVDKLKQYDVYTVIQY